MKYFFLLVLVAVGAGAYLWFEQPETWNSYLMALKAPVKTNPDSSGTIDSNTATPQPPPVPSPPHPQIISPNSSNYVNPEHIKPVDQPPAPTTNAPSANSNL